MESLTRSRVGIFGIEDALTLAKLEKLRDKDKILDVIIPPDAIFAKERAVTVNEQGSRMAQNGNQLGWAQIAREKGNIRFTDGEQVRVYDSQGKFYGLYAYHGADNALKPVKMFLT